MKHASRLVTDDRQKRIVKLFDRIDQSVPRWQTWADFVSLAAIAISNTVDKRHAAEREKQYVSIAGKYRSSDMQVFAEIFAEVVQGMENNPDQDMLGEMYMALGLGNDHSGQFFTPYDVCRAMSKMVNSDVFVEKIEQTGWICVNDPACGAGALLVSFANECLEKGINYQTSVLFVAQDIDFVVGCMCYIQLSLLGCPGYVVIGDSICHPSTSYDPRGLIPKDDGNVWYTPFYFRDIWHWRRQIAAMQAMFPQEGSPEEDSLKDDPSESDCSNTSSQIDPHPADPEIIELNATDDGQFTLF